VGSPVPGPIPEWPGLTQRTGSPSALTTAYRSRCAESPGLPPSVASGLARPNARRLGRCQTQPFALSVGHRQRVTVPPNGEPDLGRDRARTARSAFGCPSVETPSIRRNVGHRVGLCLLSVVFNRSTAQCSAGTGSRTGKADDHGRSIRRSTRRSGSNCWRTTECRRRLSRILRHPTEVRFGGGSRSAATALNPTLGRP
jgi:hypothetical protein